MSIWDTPGALDFLLERYKNGDSSGVMADKLCLKFDLEITRSAVIGKIDRMGWNTDAEILKERRKNGGATSFDHALKDRAAAVRAGKAKPGGAPTFNTPSQPKRNKDWSFAVGDTIPREPLPAEDAPPPALVKFDDLTSRSCRFIYGDPRHADHGYCGKQTVLGQSWCPDHCRRVFLTPETRPRRPKITRIPTFADLEKV